jgi:DNA modification methylase
MKFDLGNSTVFHGNFRQYLTEIPDDAIVVTDPPYNINFPYAEHVDLMPDWEYMEMLAELSRFRKIAIIDYPEETMKWIVPALGPANHVACWCYNSNIPRRFRLISFYGVTPDYSRIKQPYKNPQDKRVQELIQSGSKGTNLYEWWDDIQLVKNVSQEKGIHPCPIPKKLALRIITLISDGEPVFDPFAGSLTVLEAAKDLGLKSYGCEKTLDYIKSGLPRLEQGVLFGAA